MRKLMQHKILAICMIILIALITACINVELGGAAGLLMAEGAAGGTETENISIPKLDNGQNLAEFIATATSDVIKKYNEQFVQELDKRLPAQNEVITGVTPVWEQVLSNSEKSVKNDRERRRLGMNRIIRNIVYNRLDLIPDELKPQIQNADVVEGATDAAGGILIPSPMLNTILDNLTENNLAAQLTTEIRLGNKDLKVPELLTNIQGDWVAAKGEKPVDAPEFTSQLLQAHKYAVIIPFTEEILQDVDLDLEAWVTMFAEKDFDRNRDYTLFHGAETADGDIYGLYDVPDMTEIVMNAGKVLYSDVLYDNLIELTTAVPLSKIAGGGIGYTMHRSTWGKIKKLKNNNGDYILSAAERKAMEIEGYPVFLSEQAANTAEAVQAGKRFITFGAHKPNIWKPTKFGMTMKKTDTATINIGGVQYNLWQRNMKAIMLEEKFGFHYPFAENIAALKTAAA